MIEARVFKNADGATMPYRLIKPPGYDPAKRYPLVLCLHGAGGRGTDNQSRGTEAFKVLSTAEAQATHAAFLLTPQCPSKRLWVNWPWKRGSYSLQDVPISDPLKLAVQILDDVTSRCSVDTNRVYVTGQSMGGFGTWDIILRYPDTFAAAIPICGGGDPTEAKRITRLPVWAFHGGKDSTVPVEGTREMAAALKALRRAPARYTEYPSVGHGCWRNAWKEKELIPWLFSQNRQKHSGQ